MLESTVPMVNGSNPACNCRDTLYPESQKQSCVNAAGGVMFNSDAMYAVWQTKSKVQARNA